MTAITIEDKLATLIDKATAGDSDHRQHLGASLVGHECERLIWHTFRWAFVQRFPGRIKRLFRRGQNEENTVIADLREAGMTVTECLNQQKLHYIAPHVGCTPDGLLVGHPEAPKTRHSLEIKTHSLKSFNEVAKDGVKKAKPQHYAQMHCEMVAQNTDRAVYVAVCKDDDRIYTERIHIDWDYAKKIVERGRRIALSERAPEPCAGGGPMWFACKMCGAHDLCWGSKLTKEVNCRTCLHSTPMVEDAPKPVGFWHCGIYDCEIPIEGQREGCDCHVLHPDLVNWTLDADASSEKEAVWIIDGKPVRNGDPCANVYSSREIVANPSACANPDEIMQGMREEMGARVVG